MDREGQHIAYQQTDSIRLKCTVNLDQLLEIGDRARFEEKWRSFLHSDPCNEESFELDAKRLTYSSEHLIPKKRDDRPPLLLVFGNPASHSVAAGMFFAFKNGKENRFWKNILEPAGILSFPTGELLCEEKMNAGRRKQMIDLDYESPFRIGLSIFISMPSAPAGLWGGVAGVQKLIGIRALRRLEAEESKRIIECARASIGDDCRGKVVAFQKNAWEGLRSEESCE